MTQNTLKKNTGSTGYPYRENVIFPKMTVQSCPLLQNETNGNLKQGGIPSCKTATCHS